MSKLKKDFVIFGENNPSKIRYTQKKDRKMKKITLFLTFFSLFLKKCKKKGIVSSKNVRKNLKITLKLLYEIISVQ